MWGWTLLEQFVQDLRYALRGMINNRVFTLLVALSLALGIGANTAINMSMEEFVRDLSMLLQAPVTDTTELKGKYDFTLSWVFDISPASGGGPDLFGAIQEQLGLKLAGRRNRSI